MYYNCYRDTRRNGYGYISYYYDYIQVISDQVLRSYADTQQTQIKRKSLLLLPQLPQLTIQSIILPLQPNILLLQQHRLLRQLTHSPISILQLDHQLPIICPKTCVLILLIIVESEG